MSVIDAPVVGAYHLVTALTPIGGAAVAIVLFTVGVRLVLLPLAVRATHGERVRTRLLPKVEKLRSRYGKDPQRLNRELSKLYAAEGATPFAGCLPVLAQWPFFFVMYRLFISATIAGQQNVLLAHTLLGVPLGETWIGVLTVAGPFSPQALVFYVLMALLAAVAWWSARRLETPIALLRLLPYGSVIVAGFVPLAAGIHLLTTTAWTAAERRTFTAIAGLTR